MARPLDDTLALDDLATWARPGTHLAVLGYPVDHSLSPPMHRAALQTMAAIDPRFEDWHYWKFAVPPGQLRFALGLFHQKGFLGLNLTVPHKILALEWLAELDPAARTIGAVNTLRRTPAGYAGFNTDGYGLAAGLLASLGCSLRGAVVVLLGAGGAARGAAIECLRQGVGALWLGNRSRDSLDELLTAIQPHAGTIPLRAFLLAAPPPDLPAGALVINATSAGLHPHTPPPADLATWPQPAGVYDMIYNPPQTPLLAAAARLGIPAANGLSMLVHQGARALELWSGVAVPAAEMQRAATAALASRL